MHVMYKHIKYSVLARPPRPPAVTSPTVDIDNNRSSNTTNNNNNLCYRQRIKLDILENS